MKGQGCVRQCRETRDMEQRDPSSCTLGAGGEGERYRASPSPSRSGVPPAPLCPHPAGPSPRCGSLGIISGA